MCWIGRGARCRSVTKVPTIGQWLVVWITRLGASELHCQRSWTVIFISRGDCHRGPVAHVGNLSNLTGRSIKLDIVEAAIHGIPRDSCQRSKPSVAHEVTHLDRPIIFVKNKTLDPALPPIGMKIGVLIFGREIGVCVPGAPDRAIALEL